MFNFNWNCLLYAQFCVFHCSQLDVNNNNRFPLLFLCLYLLHKREQLLDNSSADLYNGDLQTTIILFKHIVFSHKTLWTFTNSVVCFALPLIWQRKHSDVSSWMRMFVASSFRDLYKCKHCCFIMVVCVFCLPLFLSCLSVYFCLLVQHFLCWHLLLY